MIPWFAVFPRRFPLTQLETPQPWKSPLRSFCSPKKLKGPIWLPYIQSKSIHSNTFSDSTYSPSIIISSFPSLPKHFGSLFFFFWKVLFFKHLITQIFPLSFFLGRLFRPTNQQKKATPTGGFLGFSDLRLDPIVPCQVVLMAPEEFTFLCESFAATWYPHGVCFFWNTKDMMFS